jgi:hypothetical protein
MGSLFKSPKAPQPMNVGAVGQQQQAENTRSAFQNASFNRINQSDQFGNTLNYNQTGTDAQGNPIFSASQGLGATGQQFAGGFSQLGQQYFNNAGNRPDLGSNAAFDRAYQYASANLEPRFQRASDAMDNKLRNQGFDPTSEGYKSAANDLALQQNEARNNLVTGLQGQMFSQGLQDRQQQMSELNPGLQFGQQTLNPNYVIAPQVNTGGPVDYAGLNAQNYQQQMNTYNEQMKQRNAMLGGLASIGGTIAGAALGGPIGASIGKSMFGGDAKAAAGGDNNDPGGTYTAANPQWATSVTMAPRPAYAGYAADPRRPWG